MIWMIWGTPMTEKPPYKDMFVNVCTKILTKPKKDDLCGIRGSVYEITFRPT